MSSRHVKALQGGIIGLPPADHDDDDEDEEDDDLNTSTKNNDRAKFQMLLESSDEEDDEDDEDHEEETEEDEDNHQEDAVLVGTPSSSEEGKETMAAEKQGPQATATKPNAITTHQKKGQEKGKGEEDDDFLLLEASMNEAAAHNRDHEEGANILSADSSKHLFFVLDTRALNVENEIKSKFGGQGGDGEGGGRRLGGGGRPRGGGIRQRGSIVTELYSRRCFLGPPKEDWPRPPTYVGGGIRMVRTEAPEDCVYQEDKYADWFVYEGSPAYLILLNDYMRVQASHDPNALAIFLAHHPYVVEGLLSFALLFAYTGQMDRAMEYIRKCLFVLEAAYTESFRPSEGGRCRMDARRKENRTFFVALFRHIQMVGARGLYRTAFEVGRLLLSLDPRGDPMGILLCLDFYAIRAGMGEKLLALRDSDLKIGMPLKVQEEEGDNEEKEDLTCDTQRPVPVGALPNICYSSALAFLYKGQRNEAKDTLREALLRFPIVVKRMVEKCKATLGASRVTQPWNPILNHGFISGAAARLPPDCVIPQLVSIYVQRSHELWGAPDAMEFLFEGAKEVVIEVDQGSWGYKEESKEIEEHYFEGTPLQKYSKASVVEYVDEFPHLPPEMNPLDPVLADPAIARRGRLNLRRQWDPRHQGINAAWLMREEIGGGYSHRLSPDLPLMELFWRTLLPWNDVERR